MPLRGGPYVDLLLAATWDDAATSSSVVLDPTILPA
jgi:hypothetical protein